MLTMQNSKQTVTQAQDQTREARAVKNQCFRGSPEVMASDEGEFKSQHQQAWALDQGLSYKKPQLYPDSS